jgi:ribonuclease R
VCVETLEGGGFRLWVAIADVAHFVPEGGALDREARRRGHSVYFPDRAIPMLPERLSGELCSLRPGVDRLALAVELTLDARGALQGAHFDEAVIRSRARLVYDAAARVMEGDTSSDVPGGEVTEQLQRLAVLALRLSKRRFAAGAIDFDLPSAEIVLGDEGHPTDIVEAPRTLAHRAIEEAMLLANRAVAERLVAAEVPALYRVHEAPTPTALEGLRTLLEAFGLLDLPRDAPLGLREIAAAVQRAVGRPEERVVTTRRCARCARRATTRAVSDISRWPSTPTCISRRRSAATPIWSCTARCATRSVTTPKRVRGRRCERSGWRPGRCARRSASARQWKPSARPWT